MPPAPSVKIERSGEMVTVSWSTESIGTLLEADEVTGPWQPASGGSNPYSVTASAAKKFYRVAIP